MTITDGYKLGIGIILAFITFGVVCLVVVLLYTAATTPRFIGWTPTTPVIVEVPKP